MQDLRDKQHACRRHETMKKAMAILWGTLALVSMVFCSGALGDKIYKWVDEKGVAHYSDHQPDDPATPKGTVEEREIQGPSPVKGNTQQAVPPATRSPIEYATRCTFIIRGSRSNPPFRSWGI